MIIAFESGTNIQKAFADEKKENESDLNNETTVVKEIVDLGLNDDTNVRVQLSEKTEFSISNETFENSISEENFGISLKEIYDIKDSIKEEHDRRASIRAKSYSNTQTQGGLVDIANPDPNYTGRVVNLKASDRDLFERLVYGEAGGQGFVGACLVAQCIRDMWILGGYTDANTLRRSCGYTGSINNGTSQMCKDAVNYIFDQGGYAVKHRILYFYAYGVCNSKFHESQNFVIQYSGHRVFDRWKWLWLLKVEEQLEIDIEEII